MPAASEKPILFSNPMVRAILNGEKTVTRRPVVSLVGRRRAGIRYAGKISELSHNVMVPSAWAFRNSKGRWHETVPDILPYCPFGVPGDRLWVRETWAPNVPGCDAQGGYSYRADHFCFDGDGSVRIKWHPAIHMPRAASRLTLEITDIAVERVQDITDKDAWNEGIDALDGFFDDADLCATAQKHGLMVEDAVTTFVHMWDATYAARGLGWADNPWVWVVRFSVNISGAGS